MAWPKQPERLRGLTAWVWVTFHCALMLAASFAGLLALMFAFFQMHVLPLIVLCATIVIVALLLTCWIDNNWFPYPAVVSLGLVAFGMLWFGLALRTPLPGEAAGAIVFGLIFGLMSGVTGSFHDRTLELIGDRSIELRWASVTLIAITVLFGGVEPLLPVWATVAISGSMILSGLVLAWRLPKVGSPHIAIAMLPAAGVVGCIVPLIDVIDSNVGLALLSSTLPSFVAFAYFVAILWRDDRIWDLIRWSHPAAERATQLRESGANWDETLRTLEQEGFRFADRVFAVRELERQNHLEATRFVKFYQHPSSTSEP